MNIEHLQLLNYLYFIIIPIIVYFIIFNYIFKKLNIKKKEPRSIFLQNEIPDDLTPLEVDYILTGNIRSNIMSAEIIYLATKGYLKIKKVGNGYYGFPYRSRDDYEFTLLKEIKLLPSFPDRELLRLIFKSSIAPIGSVNKLSNSMLAHFFHGDYANLLFISKSEIEKQFINKNYFNNSATSNFKMRSLWIILFALFICAMLWILIYIIPVNIIIISNIFSISFFIIYGSIFYYGSFVTSKTPEGLLLIQKIYNFKDFLKDEINNVIDSEDNMKKNIDIFKKHFPYTVSLGLEDEWVNKFKNMNIKSPSWFGEEGKNSTISDVLLFNSVIDKI